MAHVYTSLIRAKMALPGKLPPMTPLTEDAKEILDPAFTIGLGALEEDAEMGLRCPVRGCGKWFHILSRHLTQTHGDIGGKVAVMDALDLPRMTKLTSHKYRQQRRFKWDSLDADDPRRVRLRKAGERMRELFMMGVYKRHYPIKGLGTAGFGNHRNRCEAQMREPLLALQKKLKRPPTFHEAAAEISEAFVWHCISLYGNWNAAKAALGIDVYGLGVSPRRKHRASREHVLAQLKAYVEVHGQLPLSRQAQNPSRKPLIPCLETIMQAFGATTWGEAMREACIALNITDGRWGTREHPKQWANSHKRMTHRKAQAVA